MGDTNYIPPKVWTWNKEGEAGFANINRPIAGSTHDKILPVGKHPFQLYSFATPNGAKIGIMFEELLGAGHADAEYDAWPIDIRAGNQFGSDFTEINPNSKIPALLDRSTNPPTRVFESGSILLYLAEKFGAFLPKDLGNRTECLNWLFWQMGAAPFLGGGFGHFYHFAPVKIEYAINRYAMETKRQLDVLEQHLAKNEWIVGTDYSIADIAICPWYGRVVRGELYGDAATFLSVHEYPQVKRWAEAFNARPAVKRGQMVNRTWGPPAGQLPERHDANDFETKTMDKIKVG